MLEAMQEFVNQSQTRAAIERACDECEAELRAGSALEMSYRVVIPELELTGELAGMRSLWVFGFAPAGKSDIHKHSNSTQYTRAWRGKGAMRIGDPERAVDVALPPESEAGAAERQWSLIPTGVFHQGVAGESGWCVVSFQTAPATQLQDEPYEGESHFYLTEQP
jgi:hypothetical protein